MKERLKKWRDGTCVVRKGKTKYRVCLPILEKDSYRYTKAFCRYSATLKRTLRAKTKNPDSILERLFPYCRTPSRLTNPNDPNRYHYVFIPYIIFDAYIVFIKSLTIIIYIL